MFSCSVRFPLSRFAPAFVALLLLGPMAARAQFDSKPKLTTLHRFDGRYGANPQSAPTLASDGCFYGVTLSGGPDNGGTAYKVTPAGKFTTLHFFRSSDGTSPVASLTEGADGALYGTASAGGAKGFGTVFRLTKTGDYSVLHTFTGTDGRNPYATLTLAPDGSFYGSTVLGGTNALGTVFHMTAAGDVTTLYNFALAGGGQDFGGVVFGPDDALYGTAVAGGGKGYGTLFRLSTDGVSYTVLHDFSSTDGIALSALTLGDGGFLYGTAQFGLVPGILFRVSPVGQFITLHHFSEDGHGTQPNAAPTMGPNGLFYGTTSAGGTDNRGTVFQMTPEGGVTTLYKFHTAFDGSTVYARVVFGPGGALYGVTNTGGAKGGGTLFRLVLPLSTD